MLRIGTVEIKQPVIVASGPLTRSFGLLKTPRPLAATPSCSN